MAIVVNIIIIIKKISHKLKNNKSNRLVRKQNMKCILNSTKQVVDVTMNKMKMVQNNLKMKMPKMMIDYVFRFEYTL